ncbi:MAG: hypothetical protein ACO1QS_18370 [Verrucomicrobiota bacterium]
MPECVYSNSIDDCIWHDDPADPMFTLIEVTITEEKGNCFDGECLNLTPFTEVTDFFFLCTGT